MKALLAITITTSALLIAGCGSDSGGDASGPQADAAAAVIADADAEGFTLDEDCINDLTSQLSDEDAEKLAAAGGGDADLSPEGEALGDKAFDCADEDALVELFVAGMNESGENFDEECVRDQLADFDIREVLAATESDEPPADLVAAIIPCIAGDTTTTEG